MTMMTGRAVVIGASGGIGAALAAALTARGHDVVGLARSFAGDAHLDLGDEASIAAAAARAGADGAVSLVVIATGVLADATVAPERSLAALTPAGLAHYFAANAIGPALVLKHFAPLLPRRGAATIAALSARVGSIGDNRLGGWYGYRASKAALNMLVATAAIELARSRPDATCVALHPGTVATALSRPFTARTPAERVFAPADAAERLLRVLDALTPTDSGGCFAWDGTRVTP